MARSLRVFVHLGPVRILPPEFPRESPGRVPVRDREAGKMNAQIGKEAPDFTANAFHQNHLKKVRLSDYRGQWVMLFFYPADFSIV